MTPKAHPATIFELKSVTLNALVLWLRTLDLAVLAQALSTRYDNAPGMFENEPVVIDLSALQHFDAAPDFAAMGSLLRRYGLNPVAVRSGSVAQMAAALAAGLAEASAPEPFVAAVQAPQASPAPDAAPPPTEAVAEAMSLPALVWDRSLRSGQQVYARGRDLVVLGAVNYGADVLADGSIHVYGPLRGRAFAGAKGDTTARVFATCMEPQLVSVGGLWKLIEETLPADVAGKPAHARLEGSEIRFAPLKI